MLRPVRGTHDLLPMEMGIHRHVTDISRKVAECYGFDEMATPIFEFSNVFARTLGETSDIVKKEMYSFVDQGGDDITLRPENTAGIARSFITEGLAQHVPIKFFYSGPMFRRERPQKGRLRQFHQIGVEYIGSDAPIADVEVIAVGAHILDELGVRANTELELNTLGDTSSRMRYRKELITYFNDFVDQLSEDSRNRLKYNPLRILDSKDKGDQKVLKGVPSYKDFLTEESSDFFGRVREGLDALSIGYKVNERLVRGLDYYCHTAFEFKTTQLGSQNAVLAGGRYDGLIETLGGPYTPGVGWAAGIERLVMLTKGGVRQRRPIVIVPIGNIADVPALRLSAELRKAGFRVDIGIGENLNKRMRRANKINAVAVILLGEDELANGIITLRDMETGQQRSIPKDRVVSELSSYL